MRPKAGDTVVFILTQGKKEHTGKVLFQNGKYKDCIVVFSKSKKCSILNENYIGSLKCEMSDFPYKCTMVKDIERYCNKRVLCIYEDNIVEIIPAGDDQ